MDEYDLGEDEVVLDEDQIIERFLGENPRADDVRSMRIALEERRRTIKRERAQAKDDRERASFAAKISELNKQIRVMREEEAITQFVESSVRLTLHKPAKEDEEE